MLPAPDAPVVSHHRGADGRAESLGAKSQRIGVGVQCRGHRGGPGSHSGLQRGEGQLVRADGAGQWVLGHSGHHVGPTEHHAGLGPSEQFVAAGGDDVGALGQRGRGVGLVWQQRVGRQ